MNQQARTERKSKTKPQKLQQSRGTSKHQDSREIHISKPCKSLLIKAATRLNAEPIEIAQRAIDSYAEFMEAYPTLTEAQQQFVQCDAFLGFFPSSRLHKLDRVCSIYAVNLNQAANAAINVFVEFAARTTGRFEELLKDEPGSMDPGQIEYILCLPSEAATSFVSSFAARLFHEPFKEARYKFAGLLELTRHHPGLRNEAEALEMIVEGVNRLS